MPSTRPQSNPSRPSCGLQRADVVAAQVRGDSLSGRSPSRHDASTSASHVGSSHVPWSCRPRCCWNARTAASVAAQNDAGLGAGRREPGAAEPALEVADGVAVLAGGQLGGNEEFVELLEQLGLALGADEALVHLAAENTSSVGMLITL